MARIISNGKVVEYEIGDAIDLQFTQLNCMDFEADIAKKHLERLRKFLKNYFYNTNPTSDRDFNVEVGMFAHEYKEKVEEAITHIEWLLEDIENQKEMIFDTFGKEA